MQLKGVTLNEIRQWSVYDPDLDAYVFTLGDRLEVTSMQKKHVNRVLSSRLSFNVLEDRMMVKYTPSNIVLFDTELIERTTPVTNISCEIDSITKQLKVGLMNKYQQGTGILMLSGKLSANGFIEQHYNILSGSQLSRSNAVTKISLLSVGLSGHRLCGVFLIPQERSLAYTDESMVSEHSPRNAMLAYSTVTHGLRRCENWGRLIIDDWFDGATVAKAQ